MRLSIRTLSLWAVLFFGLIFLGAMLGLLLAVTRQGRALEAAANSVAAEAQVDELERSLLAYQRLANLSLSTGEPEIFSERQRRWKDFLNQLEALGQRFRATEDAPLVNTITAATQLYYWVRTTHELGGATLNQVVLHTRPTLGQALDRIELLRQKLATETVQEQAAANRWNRLAVTIGLAVALLLALGLAAVVSGVRRHIVRPVLELSEIMRRFRQGDRQARATHCAAQETEGIAQTFNEMAETIEQQRQLRLAFMAGVAHDLRNPLTVLTAGLQLLERDLPQQQAAELRSRLERQLRRLARMAGDLLDSAHIEAGTLDIQQEELDLGQLTKEVVDSLAQRTSSHSLQLTAADAPLWVQADPGRLEQVLENLLSNAIKYSPTGSTVEVAARAAGAQAELSVVDHGIGIDPDDLQEIFLPFYRRVAARKTAAGTGIGLSVVRAIVAAHDGSLEVTSTPGEGSCFCMRLPRAQSSAIRPAPAH